MKSYRELHKFITVNGRTWHIPHHDGDGRAVEQLEYGFIVGCAKLPPKDPPVPATVTYTLAGSTESKTLAAGQTAPVVEGMAFTVTAGTN